MGEYSEHCPRKILGYICTVKTEYMYMAIVRCNEVCEFVRKKKRKLAKSLKEVK